MDQQKGASKPKNKILKFLPRATSVSFQSPPLYSPAKDKRSSEKTHKSHLGYGFSGPLVSMAPAGSRRKIKNESPYTIIFEPTSPRVSCMGQVKCKHLKQKPSNKTTKKPPTSEDEHEKASENKKKSGLLRLFGGSRRNSDGINNKSAAPLCLEKAPSLGTMKRFASGRDAFSSFDWTTQVAPVDSDHRSCYSDEERGGGSDEEGDEELMIPCSAPIVMRNNENFIRVPGITLEPRKEINLWKRRTMPQPKPLQLHAT